jgi:hypothetical protein
MPLTLSDDQVAYLRQQLATGQQDAEIRKAVEGVWNHKDHGDRAKALFKDVYPDAQIGDYDLKNALTQRMDAFEKKQEEADKAKREAEAKAHYEAQRADVQKRYGFTDDAMGRMEKQMDERKVYDYEVMAQHFASREPKPIGDTNTGHFWHHDRQKEFKEISSDPEGYAFNEIVKAIQSDENTRRNR